MDVVANPKAFRPKYGSTTKTAVGLTPRELRYTVKSDKPIAAFRLNLPYTITDAGIAPGENIAGVINKVVGMRRGDKEACIYFERDCMVEFATMLHQAAYHYDPTNQTWPLAGIVSNATPVTTVLQNSGVMLVGPWKPGTYDFLLAQGNVVDEFGGAAAFQIDFSVDIMENLRGQAPKAPYMQAARMVRKYQANDIDLQAKCTGFYLNTGMGTVVTAVSVNNRALSAADIEKTRRDHQVNIDGLQFAAVAALDASLHLHHSTPATVTVALNAPTDISWGAYFRAPLVTPRTTAPRRPGKREGADDIFGSSRVEAEHELAEFPDDLMAAISASENGADDSLTEDEELSSEDDDQ